MRSNHLFNASARLAHVKVIAIGIALAAVLSRGGASQAQPSPIKCGNTTTVGGELLPAGAGQDLEVSGGLCTVDGSAAGGKYTYANVNIYKGGALYFKDAPIDFFAKSILVENNGLLAAGVASVVCTETSGVVNCTTGAITPIGTAGRRQNGNSGVLAFHLYGADLGRHGAGITCKTPVVSGVPCGIDPDAWNKGSSGKVTLPGGTVKDYFYKYEPLPYDDGSPAGYFGYKVLAASWGGTLKLYGAKGASYTKVDPDADKPDNTGTSWVRLTKSLKPQDKEMVVAGLVDWQKDDHIVITSTDYLPGHAEELVIQFAAQNMMDKTTTIRFTNATPEVTGVQYHHWGVQYSLAGIPSGIGPTNPDGKTPMAAMENRAAVALLSRSIVIQSEGATATDALGPKDYFGGHTVVREGVKSFQLQGVEFRQLGQGGKLGHYPVHFHMVRQAPPNTFVKDCSVNESMTRWYVLHATQGVTLQRDVGWKSIGHGFYLEEGTETNNKLYANIGILARAAVLNAQNDRSVPGILASLDYPIIIKPNGDKVVATAADDVVPYHSDWDHPSVFWIMNGWNDFEYNMAAGAGTCGVCYWLLPGGISGGSRPPMMTWESYASEQTPGREGTSPLQTFIGNSCSSAMGSFLTIANATACFGVQLAPNPPDFPVVNPVTAGVLAPGAQSTKPDENGLDADNFYPKLGGGGRFPTKCPATGDCSAVKVCASGEAEANCLITAIDHYTSSFNWAETNFAAIWLRPQWYLFINSILSDVQNGGITFVTGGGYTQSDTINGHWALARKDVFIGHTQPFTTNVNGSKTPNVPDNPFASDAGPFNPGTGLPCEKKPSRAAPGNYCLSTNDGVSFPLGNFANNQRLFSIYDGPAYEDANAYLDITKTNVGDPANTNPFSDCIHVPSTWNFDNHSCDQTKWAAAHTLAVPYDPNHGTDATGCYLPNAAIAWKQPNGFFYPPAFHSDKLYFHKVDIRHFVIEPGFAPAAGVDSKPAVDKMGVFSCPNQTSPYGIYSQLQMDHTCCPINTKKTNGKCVPTFLFETDQFAARAKYCTYNATMFDNYTDVDRQTELNDDDGTLTGLINTISVNQDKFFGAPVETPECLSDVGVTPSASSADPAKYPGTAVTSPYDYVTTVVFPKCAANGEGATCGAEWAQDCTNPQCYGVPVYRQKLKPAEVGMSPPVIRLMGQSNWQRSSLTTYNNTYYVDTSPSFKAQQTRYAAITHYNVFQKDQTYYLFLVFAKPATRQTYDIFVGANDDGFEKTNTNNVPAGSPFFLTRVSVPSSYLFDDTQAWPAGWSHNYDKTSGILRITMDMSKVSDFKTNYDTERKNKCQPESFCKWTGAAANPCQCSITDTKDPLYNECHQPAAGLDAVCRWAVKDVDCPAGGCYGFGVTLSSKFVNSDSPPNPAPTTECFKKTDPGWNVPWNKITTASDACLYTDNTPPAGLFCP